MDTPKKNKSLIGIIIFLLISNIAMLIFFLVLSNGSKNARPPHKDIISTFLKADIGFDQKQMDEYDTLRKEHMDKMRPFFESIHNSKDSFYNFLYANAPDSEINKAAAVIGEKQIYLDVQMFRHLKNVRNICTPDQLQKFDTSFNNVIAKITQHFRKPTPKTK